MATPDVATAHHNSTQQPLRVALVVPHIFMSRELLPQVIFSPGQLALDLATGLAAHDTNITLFTPAPTNTQVKNITADMSYFQHELDQRGYGYMELLKKHPATFVALARQVQAELIANAYARANAGEFDLVHIYANEEDLALQFARFCTKPTLFTHHDPFNFLIKYKSIMPKYRHLRWISISHAQRAGMPPDTNWVANIYHGLNPADYTPNFHPTGNYLAFVGRIIEPKGVHLAIAAAQLYNRKHPDQPLQLKIAGKHYSDSSKDQYWTEIIEPQLADPNIEYVGFLQGSKLKDLLRNAQALIVPSTFDEPFGMVTLEALASATPVIGLDRGATKEIITDDVTGFIVKTPPIKSTSNLSLAQRTQLQTSSEIQITIDLATAIVQIPTLNRHTCRTHLEQNFTLAQMIIKHAELYKKLATQ